MEHWYKIYVLNRETIEVTDNGPVDMWLYAEMTDKDTTDLDPIYPDTVWDTSGADQWYYLVTRPGGADEDYVLNFVFM